MIKKIGVFILIYLLFLPKISFATSVISFNNNSQYISNINLEDVSIISFYNGSETLLNSTQISTLTAYSNNSYTNFSNNSLKISQLVPNFNTSLNYVSLYDLNGNKKTYLNANENVIFIEQTQNWIKVLYKNTEFFLNAEEISLYVTITSQQDIILKREPNINSESINVLNYGENIQVLQDLGDWIYIKDSSQNFGYILSDFNLQINQSTKEEFFSPQASEVIAYAQQFLGSPYVFGGTDLQTGTDCSGFIYLIFQNFGIDLPRTSKEQYFAGDFVSKEDLQPGDLVFFSYSDENSISHIGIYIGNDEYIHSSEEQYGVIISSLNNPYSINYYFGARRIF